MKKISILFFILLSAGCVTQAPVSSMVSTSIEQKHSCRKICTDMEMDLGGMVFVSNRAGCVCNEKGANTSLNSSSAAASAVIASIIEEESQTRKRNNNN